VAHGDGVQVMTDREAFEKWLKDSGISAAETPVHLAFRAWQAATKNQDAAIKAAKLETVHTVTKHIVLELEGLASEHAMNQIYATANRIAKEIEGKSDGN
jgi:hypothetical protein